MSYNCTVLKNVVEVVEIPCSEKKCIINFENNKKNTTSVCRRLSFLV